MKSMKNVALAIAFVMIFSALVPVGFGMVGSVTDMAKGVSIQTATPTDAQKSPHVAMTPQVSASGWTFPTPSTASCFGATPVTFDGTKIPNGTAGIRWIGGSNNSHSFALPQTIVLNNTCEFPKGTSDVLKYNVTDENPASIIYVVNSTLKMLQQAPTAAKGYKDMSTVGSLYIYNSTLAANNTTGNTHWSTDANGTASFYVTLGVYGAVNGATACPTTWHPVFYANNAKFQNNTSVDWGSVYGPNGDVAGGTSPSWPSCTANSNFYLIDSTVNGTVAYGSATSEVFGTTITEVGHPETATTGWSPNLLADNVSATAVNTQVFAVHENGLLVHTYYPLEYSSTVNPVDTQCPHALVNYTSVGVVEVCAFSTSPFKASPPLNETVIANVTVTNINATVSDVLIVNSASHSWTLGKYVTVTNMTANITNLKVVARGGYSFYGVGIADVSSPNGGLINTVGLPVNLNQFNVTALPNLQTSSIPAGSNTYLQSTWYSVPDAYLAIGTDADQSVSNVGMYVPLAYAHIGIWMGDIGAYGLVNNVTVHDTNIPEASGSTIADVESGGSVYFSTDCTTVSCPNNLASLDPTIPASLVGDVLWPAFLLENSNLKETNVNTTANVNLVLATNGGMTHVLYDNTLTMTNDWAIAMSNTPGADKSFVYHDSATYAATSIAADYLFGNTIDVNATGTIGVIGPAYYTNLTQNAVTLTGYMNNYSADAGYTSLIDAYATNGVFDLVNNSITGNGYWLAGAGKHPPAVPSMTNWFTGVNGAYQVPAVSLFVSGEFYESSMQTMVGNTITLSGPTVDFFGNGWVGPGTYKYSTTNSLSWSGYFNPHMTAVTSQTPTGITNPVTGPLTTNISAIPIGQTVGFAMVGGGAGGGSGSEYPAAYTIQNAPVLTGSPQPTVTGNTFADSNNAIFDTSAGMYSLFADNGNGNFMVNSTWTVGVYYLVTGSPRAAAAYNGGMIVMPMVVGPNTWTFDSSSFFSYQSGDLIVEGTTVPQVMLSYCQSGDTCTSSSDAQFYTSLYIGATASAIVAAPTSSEYKGSTFIGEELVYGSMLALDPYYTPGHAWTLSSSTSGIVQSGVQTVTDGGNWQTMNQWWTVAKYFTVSTLSGTTAPSSLTWTLTMDGTTMLSFPSTTTGSLFVQSFNSAERTAVSIRLVSTGLLPGSEIEVEMSGFANTTLNVPKDLSMSVLDGIAVSTPVYAANHGLLDGNYTIPSSDVVRGMMTSMPVIQSAVPYTEKGFTVKLPSQGAPYDVGMPFVPVFYSIDPVTFLVVPSTAVGAVTFNLPYVPTQVWSSSLNSSTVFNLTSVQKNLLGYEFYAIWTGANSVLPTGVNASQVVYNVNVGFVAYNSSSHWKTPASNPFTYYPTRIDFTQLNAATAYTYALFVNQIRTPAVGAVFSAPNGNFSYAISAANASYVVQSLYVPQATGLLWYQTSSFLIALVILVVAAAILAVVFYLDRSGKMKVGRAFRRAIA